MVVDGFVFLLLFSPSFTPTPSNTLSFFPSSLHLFLPSFHLTPSLLPSLSLSLSDDPLQADVWLLNSCTVKNPAEDHFRNSIKEEAQQHTNTTNHAHNAHTHTHTH